MMVSVVSSLHMVLMTHQIVRTYLVYLHAEDKYHYAKHLDGSGAWKAMARLRVGLVRQESLIRPPVPLGVRTSMSSVL